MTSNKSKNILNAHTLLLAYAQGFFPMAQSRDSTNVAWFYPEERGIIPLNPARLPRRLIPTIKKHPYHVTLNKAFADVMRHCAEAREETWINAEIERAYTDLHHKGHAHSIEVWDNTTLIGGVYGVSIGGAFFGESMFSKKTNASKIALVYLMARLWSLGLTWLDAQYVNPHLLQFGCIAVPRDDYLAMLETAISQPIIFCDQSPASSEAGAVSTGALSGCASSDKVVTAEVLAAFLQSTNQTS